MNQANLQQIIDNYIENFEMTNGPKHREYYKWQIIKRFHGMMDEALSAPAEEFPRKLYEVKKLTKNLIDSYTQPLNGLVEFSKKEPETVRSMFHDLFAASQADVLVKQSAIRDFLDRSHQLRAKYYPDSYLYNDDLHSVTGYLLCYDPDHNYLYKATHCRKFADCIEFYDDWGYGDTTKLDVFYRMCDEVLAYIKENEALLKTAASRYEIAPGTMHPDTEKHILLFDLIYCCSTYGLFKGIRFVVPKNSERRLIQERKEKAQALSVELDHAQEELQHLDEAQAFLRETFQPGTAVKHRLHGAGEVVKTGEKLYTFRFARVGEKELDLITCVVNGVIRVEDEQAQAKLLEYKDLLRRSEHIRREVSRLERELEPYAEYLD